MKKFFVVLLIGGMLSMQYTHSSYIARYKDNQIVIYKFFGYTWGWNGKERLEKKELEFLLERYEARAATKLVHASKDQLIAKKGAQELWQPDEYKEQMPSHMVIRKSNKRIWGMMQSDNTFLYPVFWQDDVDARLVSVINRTNDLLFIDTSASPENFKVTRKLRGVLTGAVRNVSVPMHGKITIWPKQLPGQDPHALFSTLIITPKTLRVIVTKQENNTIVVECEEA